MKKEKNKEKIIISAGGTLGHINPSIALADEFVSRGYQVYYITLNKNKSSKFEKYNGVLYIETFGFDRKNLFNNFKNYFKNIAVRKKIKGFFDDVNPKVLISFGSSVGSVCCSVAIKKKIKTAIHEQNYIMGLGNRLVYKKVNNVYLSMKGDKEGEVVGNPVITNYYEKYEKGIEDRVLIVCGSNGANDINDFFINNYNEFNDYKITLITGKKYYESNKERIDSVNNNNFKIIDFENNMLDRYKEAKIVICRSGSSTLSELFGMRKLIITIPSINVSDNHQYYNALYYKNLNCLEMLEEKNLSIENIRNIIKSVYSRKDEYIKSIEKTQDVFSVYKFADSVERIIGGE